MTHNELIDHFGGPTEISRMLGVTPQAVSQWRTNGIPKASLMLLQMKADSRCGLTKQEMLSIMRLLSALESWGFSNKQTLPDYLLDDIQKNVELLEREILK